MADAALRGEAGVLDVLSSSLIPVERDNLVERPWGGNRLRQYKAIPPGEPDTRWGEAFEIAAFDDDDEARRFPSRVVFDDGSRVDLPALLRQQGRALLGDAFVDRYGPCFPLLPKTLNIKELLSVQGHPAGHTEVYIIIDAEPGASLRLGFNRDIDPHQTEAALLRGLTQQHELLGLVDADIEPAAIQRIVAPWFADRESGTTSLADRAAGSFRSAGDAAISILDDLKRLYWQMLDSMNAIEVRAGQVIHNATPDRLVSGDKVASAEVHALGNPEGLEVLALEIRRPGPTFRAWDNVRFPKREVDVAQAIRALNLSATSADDFLVDKRPIPGRQGAFVSIDSEYFRVEHLLPGPGRAVSQAAAEAHSLHCIDGSVRFFADDGRPIGTLAKGESALVPARVGGYRAESSAAAEVVRVTLPES
jgi:mannose-6-phosphate isomerase class I